MNRFTQVLLTSDRIAAHALATELIATVSMEQFLDEYLVRALTQIGDQWEKGEASLSQVYMSGKICEEIIDRLLIEESSVTLNPIRIGIVVLDDFHLLGKRIVYSVLRSAGYSLLDYGRMTVDELVPRIIEDQLDILLISTLMLRAALQVETLKSQLVQRNIPTQIIVGGAPFRFDDQLWQQIGADAFGYNATDALAIIHAIEERQR